MKNDAGKKRRGCFSDTWNKRKGRRGAESAKFYFENLCVLRASAVSA